MWHLSRAATSLLTAFDLALDWPAASPPRPPIGAANGRRCATSATASSSPTPSRSSSRRGAPSTDEGRVLSSRDGKAQLLVGAFANEEETTLRTIASSSCRRTTPAPTSTTRRCATSGSSSRARIGDREFYERVSFTCGGRLINSWAMIYPKAERRFYDRVVEAVARTYSARRRPLRPMRLRRGPKAL